MSVKTLEIDGRMVTGLAGATIFSVAWDNGIHIPRLCHVGGLSDLGACRLCLVEIEGQRRFYAACMTPIEEGMVVRTATDRLKAHRKMIIELLFAERNHVCAVCVMNGGCELQDLAAEHGIDHVRLRYQFPSLAVDTSHERFGVDHNRCVLCTRCVRICDEVEGAHTWDLSGRGAGSTVIADLGQPWGDSDTCTDCGKCVQVCPTGALAEKGWAVEEMVKSNESIRKLANRRGVRV
ncbi:MAG TPA: bidirectional hydrogenase complex protein HoxU [Bryobacteraceae bacterium]|nr:bidirectional hydrogenase complex protein HoxU [Bryobacteraceae bacterium]